MSKDPMRGEVRGRQPRKTAKASSGAICLLSGTSLMAASALLGRRFRDPCASAATGSDVAIRANSRISSLSWVTISACGTSAPITAA